MYVKVLITQLFLFASLVLAKTPEDTWHVSIIRDTQNYNMPSIVFGIANIAFFDGVSYDEITNLPSDFNEYAVSDNEVFQYSGEHEILSYDINVHRASVSNPDRIYILNFTGDVLESYKLRFVEYQSGITVLEYNLLTSN